MQFNEGVSIHLNDSNAKRPHLMCHTCKPQMLVGWLLITDLKPGQSESAKRCLNIWKPCLFFVCWYFLFHRANIQGLSLYARIASLIEILERQQEGKEQNGLSHLRCYATQTG